MKHSLSLSSTKCFPNVPTTHRLRQAPISFTLGCEMLAMTGCSQSDGLAPTARDVASLVPDHNHSHELDNEQYLQGAEEALQSDLLALGWSYKEALPYQSRVDGVRRLIRTITSKDPDMYTGAALAEEAEGTPTVYVKGRAHEFVREAASEASVEIRLVDKQPYSFDDFVDRQRRTVESLNARGYDHVEAWSDIHAEGRLNVTVRPRPGRPAEANELLALLPSDLSDRTIVSFDSRAALRSDESAVGGQQLTGQEMCQAGWAVVDGGGVRGVTTAEHCESVTTINHRSDSATHSTSLQDDSALFDVAWHTTAGAETARFWARDTVIRDVEEVPSYWEIFEGVSMCAFSDQRDSHNCSADVLNHPHTCGNPLEFWVRMDSDIQIPGDSGSGWYWSRTAYGSHKGNCGSRDIHTSTDILEGALGVTVMTN